MCPLCVLAPSSRSSYERQLSRPRRAQGRSPLSIRLLVHALPTVTHLRLHWTGPPAPLSRGNLVFPTHQPLCFSPAAAGAQSYHHLSLDRPDRFQTSVCSASHFQTLLMPDVLREESVLVKITGNLKPKLAQALLTLLSSGRRNRALAHDQFMT